MHMAKEQRSRDLFEVFCVVVFFCLFVLFFFVVGEGYMYLGYIF